MRNKIIKNKKIILISLSFLLPLVTYLTIFYINGLLTDKTIISGDMYVQYYPLFNYLKGVFEGTNSIFYSFSKGLGGTMFGTIFYYLSSPLNIFLVFVGKNHIPDFMTYLIILKLSLCGFTMYLYMRRKYKTDNLLLLVFSMCYAFMGYNLNYFINIMWLDVVFMAPLVLIGLDKIIEDKSSTFYIVTLFISIFSNYYISYMLCLFCVIYFVYEILLKYNIKEDKQIIKRLTKKFIISSLIVGGLCCFFLVPCFFEMLTYGRSVSLSKVFTFDYNFLDLFSKTYIGSLSLHDTLNYSSMNMYCGVIVLPLVYLFLINKKIEKMEKILTLFVIFLMILPCFIGPLNYIWHLFTIPSFYSFRYSFLLCFFLINVSYKSIINLQISKLKVLFYLSFYLLISLMFIPITYYGNYYDFLNYKFIWLTLLFLFIYLAIMYFKLSNKHIILFFVILIELIINIEIIIMSNSHLEKEVLNDKEYNEIVKKYNYNNEYRIELYNPILENNSLLLNYRGINSFLSTTNNKTLVFLSEAGRNIINDGYQNYYNMNGQSYITSTLLNTKIIGENTENVYYKYIDSIYDNELKIYENEDSLSIGYMIKNKCNNLEYEFPFDQVLFNCIIDKNDIYYKEYKPSKVENNNYKYILKEKGRYYIYMENISEIEEKIFDDRQEKNILYYGKNLVVLENDVINNRLDLIFNIDTNTADLKVYYFCKECFKRNVNILKNEQLKYEINNNEIKSSITTKGGLLMITLPYENGFDIYVDGEKKDYMTVMDTFIGIDLEEGTHTINIKYKQPLLKIGLTISSFFIVLWLFLIVKNYKKYKLF